jgi:hypothetical protein
MTRSVVTTTSLGPHSGTCVTSPTTYVIWAERLAGAALGSTRTVSPYDGDLLARARAYEGVPIEDALWSLGRAVVDWKAAVLLAAERKALFSIQSEVRRRPRTLPSPMRTMRITTSGTSSVRRVRAVHRQGD